MSQRVLGAMAAVGGLAWILGFASLLVLPRDPYGERDATVALIATIFAGSFICIALGELGTRAGSATSRRVGHAITVASVAAAAMIVFPWPVFVIGLFAFPIIGMLAAARGAQSGVFPGWYRAVVVGLAIATLLGFLGSVGQDAAVVLMSALGLAGLALAWLTLRGQAAAEPEAGPA